MGDRGNIVVIHDNEAKEQIWLYTHWGGSVLAENLREALRAYPGRWTDPGYLTRGILMKMIPAEYRDHETGSGIYTSMCDNEHDILVCDVSEQVVYSIKESELTKDRRIPSNRSRIKHRQPVLSFEDFEKNSQTIKAA